MDVAELRKRILRELEITGSLAGDRPAVDRRAAVEAAQQAYEKLLSGIVGPLLKQTASILKAESILCQVQTPADSARLSFDRSPEDFIEFTLDPAAPPHVVGRGSVRRKGGTLVEDRVIGVGKDISDINEDDVLAFLLPELRKILK
jgi:hypothetical protein